jgi:hypothetical protein
MRVTRESLIRLAKESSQERCFNDRSIIAAYLTGSLVLDADPLLGGTTDIDLVFVHGTPPAISREIVKLSPDFHLDIRHRTRSEFKSPRELRADPILGYEMYDPMLLSEREKFFEFIQAGLRAGFEFHAPSVVLARCRKLLAEARRGWLDLSDISAGNAGALQVKQFLRAVNHVANAVAELNGAPLAERRFLLEFPARAVAAESPDFMGSLYNLLGAGQVDAPTISGWLPAWGTDFMAAAQDSRVDLSVNAARLNYYDKAIRALLATESPLTALWPLIRTWTLASQVLDARQGTPWYAACEHLGLLGAAFEARISELDGYLDQVDVRLDEIAIASGAETSANR